MSTKKQAKKKGPSKKTVKKQTVKKKSAPQKKKTSKAPTLTVHKNPNDKRKGNQYWKLRNKHGRSLIYADGELLWAACCKYFEWIEANPLFEEKIFSNQGDVTLTKITKMRAMTMKGLWLHIGLSNNTWAKYKQSDDFLHVIDMVESIVYEQKFTGAAADLLNANIISRELGLAEKKEITSAVAMVIDNQDKDA